MLHEFPQVITCSFLITTFMFAFYSCDISLQGPDLPIETSLICSLSRNSSATETFSSFIWRKLGLTWCFLYIFFWLRTSRREMSFCPSLKSLCRSVMVLLTHLRCSLHHLVKVFCWIFFHGASSAKSFSVAGISSSSSSPSSVAW